MSKLKYKCKFCDKDTNFKDIMKGALCADCYGKAYPPAPQTTISYPTYPQPFNPTHPWYPNQPNIVYC